MTKKFVHELETEDRREKTKFWLDHELGDLELLRATYVTHSFSRHTHEGYVIGVIEQGAETFEYRHKNHIAPAGSIALINPAEPHTGQAFTKNGWTYRMLYPDTKLLQQAASQLAGKPRDVPFFKEPVVYDEALAHQIFRFHRDMEGPITPLERESRLLWLFGQLIARYADDRPKPAVVNQEHEAVKRVREYLEAHYGENILLEELAQVANLSQFHLLRVFRQETGLPPHAYLSQLRVIRAKRLLLKGWPIAYVASETGFVDQSHFTRHFKRVVGVTPGQYLLTTQ